jgi:hypothetical protein
MQPNRLLGAQRAANQLWKQRGKWPGMGHSESHMKCGDWPSQLRGRVVLNGVGRILEGIWGRGFMYVLYYQGGFQMDCWHRPNGPFPLGNGHEVWPNCDGIFWPRRAAAPFSHPRHWLVPPIGQCKVATGEGEN